MAIIVSQTSNNPFEDEHKTTTMIHIDKILQGIWGLLTMAKSLASNCQVGRYEVESIVESIYVNDTKVMQQLSTRLENKTDRDCRPIL